MSAVRATDTRQHEISGLPVWATGRVGDLERHLGLGRNRLVAAVNRGTLQPAYAINGIPYVRLVDVVEYLHSVQRRYPNAKWHHKDQ